MRSADSDTCEGRLVRYRSQIVIMWCSVAHRQYTYTHTQALTRRQTQNDFVLISLPVRDQETSILRGEFVKMFQEVIHHQTSVTSVPEVGVESFEVAPYVEDWDDSLQSVHFCRDAILPGTSSYMMGNSLL